MDKALAEKKFNIPQEKHPGGRPALFDTPEDLQAKIDEYFETVEKEQESNPKRRPEISELTYFLGFASRQGFYDQRKRSPEFAYIINKARLYCQKEIARALIETDANPTKYFYILNAMGYQKDSVESKSTRISGPINIILTNEKPKLEITETNEYEILPDETDKA